MRKKTIKIPIACKKANPKWTIPEIRLVVETILTKSTKQLKNKGFVSVKIKRFGQVSSHGNRVKKTTLINRGKSVKHWRRTKKKKDFSELRLLF